MKRWDGSILYSDLGLMVVMLSFSDLLLVLAFFSPKASAGYLQGMSPPQALDSTLQ